MDSVRSPGGFSLYELLITITIVGTVAALGVPTFGSILADNRLRADVDALFHAVHLARQESVYRRRVIVLCPSVDGLSCGQGPDWSQGWIMFINLDRDLPARVDAGETVLRRHRVDPGNIVTANRASFAFRSTALRATNGTFVFCDPAGRTAARALVISYTGRPRVARTDRHGRAYECRK